MSTFTTIAPFVSGVYLLFIASRLTAHTTFASIVYILGPWLAGGASILASLKLGGFI